VIQEERLRRPAAVQSVFARGVRFANRRLILFVSEGEEGRRRCAFAAGKKLGGAVQRNRLRRRMREAYRRERKEFLRGCDLVLLARPETGMASFEDLCSALRELLRKAEEVRRTAPPSQP
jgi:ribonuclease P protein component